MTRHRPRILTLAVMASIALATSSAYAAPLPPLIDFQSVLLDEGGNLLPSGPTSIQFQILDENRAPIYTEVQSVDVVKGAASALIGNGTDAKGTSTGGVPDDIFATGAPRYLQVQVSGHAAEDPMTIVPVPYAQWSQTCASVADGGVKPASIAKAAVGFESLAPDVVGKLADALSKSQGLLTAQSLNSSGGATQIGLEAKLINSGSSSVQGALQDIDLAVKKRQEETTFLTGKVNEEVKDRGILQTNFETQMDGAKVGTIANRTGGLEFKTSNIDNIPGDLALDRLDPYSKANSDLNMGGKKIIGLGGPSSDADASTKKYVNDEDVKLQNQLTNHEGRIQTAETKLTSHESQILSAENKLTSHESRLAGLESAQADASAYPTLHLLGYWVGYIKSDNGFGVITLNSNYLSPTSVHLSSLKGSAANLVYQFSFSQPVGNATYIVTASDVADDGFGNYTTETARYYDFPSWNQSIAIDTRTVSSFDLTRQGQGWEYYQVFVYGS